MDASEKRAVKHSGIAAYISQVSRMVTGAIFSILLIKFLSQEDYGSYQLIISLNAIAVYFTSLGLATVFVRYIPEFIEQKYADGIMKLTIWGVGLRLAAVCFVILLAYCFSEFIVDYFSFSVFMRKYFTAILVFVFLAKLEETTGPMLLGAYLEQIGLSVMLAVQSALKLAVIIYSFYTEESLKTILFGLIGIEFFVCVCFLLMSIRRTARKIEEMREPVKQSFPLKRVARFGGYSFLLSSTGSFRDIMVDNFVISHFLGVGQVAVYGIAYMILNIVSRFNPTALLKNHIHHLTVRKYTEQKSEEIFQRGHRITTTMTFAFLFPAISFVAIYLEDIFELLNKSYRAPAGLVLLLIPLVISNGLMYSYSFPLDAMEKVQYRFYANIFSIYNLVADIVLIRYFGLFGIAMATASAAVLTVIYYHLIVKYVLKLKLSYYLPGLFKTIACTLTAILLSLVPVLFYKRAVLLSGIIFSLSYAAAFIFLNPFHVDDRKIFRQLVKV